jgi:hypothetical protein
MFVTINVATFSYTIYSRSASRTINSIGLPSPLGSMSGQYRSKLLSRSQQYFVHHGYSSAHQIMCVGLKHLAATNLYFIIVP